MSEEEEDFNQKRSKKKTRDEDESEGEDIGPEAPPASDSEEEEEEEENDEDRNFVVGDDEIEEEGEGEGEESRKDEDDDRHQKKRKKRKKRVIDDALDEDDYDIIEENTGRKLFREEDERRANFKRLKRKKELNEEEEPQERRPNTLERLFDDDDKPRYAPSSKKSKEKAIDLGKSDSSDIEDIHEDTGDENDDFIDDDEGGEKPVRRQKQHDDFDIEYRDSKLWQDLFSGDIQPLLQNAESEDEEDDERMMIEPSKMEESFVTDLDKRIQLADIPERMYSRASNRAIEDGELEEERNWILNHPDFKKEHESSNLASAVLSVLKFIREELLEVPCIDNHKLDYFKDVLSQDDLWRIYDLDDKWRIFWSKRKGVQDLINLLHEHTDEYLQSCFYDCQTDEELNDLHLYIKRHHGHQIAELDESKKKDFKTKDAFIIYHEAGIAKLSEKFGLTSREFGDNLQAFSKKHETITPRVIPINAAEEFYCERYSSAERKLGASKECLVLDMAVDPKIRRYVRNLYHSNATISANPTSKGKAEIEDDHIYKPFKYLSKKPVSKFRPTEFLELIKAESEGFINIVFDPMEENLIVDEFYRFFLDDAHDEYSTAWNEQRKSILDRVLKVHLIPTFQKELKIKLISEGTRVVADECAKVLKEKLMMGPFMVKDRLSDPVEKPIVFAITGGMGENQATFGCILNGVGELVSHIRLEHLRDQKSMGYMGDLKQLESFILEHRPDAVAVGTADFNSRLLFKELETIVSSTTNDKTTVTYVNDEIARIYQGSERAKKEFPDLPDLLCNAISLGRRLIDPLDEFAGLCNSKNDILCLRYHPLQNTIPQNYLLEKLQRSFMKVVAITGVDINLIVNYPHKKDTLQFVCGLGPRKAEHLYNQVQKEGLLEARQDLIIKHSVGKTVFVNCASYIKVYRSRGKKKKNSQVYDVLDQTRIHPKNYTYARRMAAAATDHDQEKIGSETNPSVYVEELWSFDQNKISKALEMLLLDDFAKQLQMTHPGQLFLATLETIKVELKLPYNERRHKFALPSYKEIFYMLTGETEYTLTSDMIIPVVVKHTNSRGDRGDRGEPDLSVTLDSGLAGTIRGTNVGAKAGPGDTLLAKVIKINYERFDVDLSTQEKDLENTQKHRYYDFESEKRDLLAKEQSQKKVSKITRKINHPQFKNFTYEEAVEYLKDKENGEIVIRPSSKGTNNLNLTYKISQDFYRNIEISEQNKANNVSVGKTLRVDVDNFQDTYEDLDEIIARCIEPMIRKSQEIMKHRKFKNVFQRELDSIIRREFEANPKYNPYYICKCDTDKYPGRFAFGYWTGYKTSFEIVSIKPLGFYFRGEKHDTVEGFVTSFKKNPSAPNTRRR